MLARILDLPSQQLIGVIAAVMLPFFNVPLIVRIVRRRSSQDLSLVWVFGVWSCTVLMAPSGFVSEDLVWRMFNIVNFVLFTAVMIVTFKYRKAAGQ